MVKKRRNIYLIFGILLVVLNLSTTLVQILAGDSRRNDISFNNLFGNNLFFVVGLVLLRAAFKLHIRIKKAEKLAFERSIDAIGTLEI